MKVLMENKKKQWIYVAIAIIAATLSIWVWTRNRSSIPKIDPSAIGSALLDDGINSVSGESLLPFGTDFNTEIFSEQRFLQLTPFNKLEVRPEELGTPNPFDFTTVTSGF